MRRRWFTAVLASLAVVSGALAQVPIFSTTLDDANSITQNPNAVNGGVLAGAAANYVTGAIGNAFQSTSSTANAGSWARWNNAKVSTIFSSWNNASGITVDLYFQGTWTGLGGTVDEGLWSMVRRSSGDLGDTYIFASLRTGKLRIAFSNSSATQYKFTFNGSAANPGAQEYAPGVDLPLTDGAIYHMTFNLGNGAFNVYLDDVGGSQYGNASPVFTDSTTLPAGFNWQLPPSTATSGGTQQAREMDIGNRGPTPNFGGTLRNGDWIDNVKIFNGVYTPTEIDAGALLPVALINPDVTSGYPPLTVHFDGSGSHDTGGTGGGSITGYAWDFDNDGTVDDTSGPMFTHAYATPGNYVCKLTVTDNDGNTAVATQPIVVNTLPATGLLAITAMEPSGNLAAGSHLLTSVTAQRAGTAQSYTLTQNLAGPPDTAHVEVTGSGITGGGAGATTPAEAFVGLELGSTVSGVNADGKFLAGYFAGLVKADGTAAPEIFFIENSNSTDNFQIQLLTNGPGATIVIVATLQVRNFDYASTSTVIGGTPRGGVAIDLDALGIPAIQGVRITGADGLGGGSGIDPSVVGGVVKPCNVPFADADGDGDVDQDDLGEFQKCYTGTPHPEAFDFANCVCFDRGTPDGVIDEADFLAFKNCRTGPTVLYSQNPPAECNP